MAATYVSVPQRMKGFSMRWVSQIGLSTLYCSVADVLYLPRPVTNADYPVLEKLSESAVKDKQKFERLVVSKEKLLEMFNVLFPSLFFQTYAHNIAQYNKYKQYLIQTKVPDGGSTTVYRCGPMVDLCVGPHIPHTGKIKAFMVTKVSVPSRSLDVAVLTNIRTLRATS